MHHIGHIGIIFQATPTKEQPWSLFQSARRSITLNGITQAKPILWKMLFYKALATSKWKRWLSTVSPYFLHIKHHSHNNNASHHQIIQHQDFNNASLPQIIQWQDFPKRCNPNETIHFGRHIRLLNTLLRKYYGKRTILQRKKKKHVFYYSA